MTKDCKQIIDFLGCPYELFIQEQDGEKITARYQALREQGKQEGFTPLIVVVSDILAETLSFVFEDCDVEETAEGIAAWRQKTISEIDTEDLADYLEETLELESYDPSKGGIDELSTHLENNAPHEEIILAKIPTNNPWETAVWIPMGGFNDCPSPARQAAMFRYWHKKYAAVPAVVTYDTWELLAGQPAKTREQAQELAKEMFLFCTDIVEQGVGTMEALASLLTDSTVWYFWWD